LLIKSIHCIKLPSLAPGKISTGDGPCNIIHRQHYDTLGKVHSERLGAFPYVRKVVLFGYNTNMINDRTVDLFDLAFTNFGNISGGKWGNIKRILFHPQFLP
jgi:hypothetical protein